MSKREIRSKIGIRAADIGGKPGVTLHAIRPGVVDDYGSLWAADAFDDALGKRLPTLCWSHDWSEPLGPAVGYRSGSDGPEIDFTFSDFDAVPMARRAHAQVLDGTIGDCSVGFSAAEKRRPTSDELREYPGIVEVITRADLDEVSLVLRGAVPGAKVVSVRSAKVDFDAFLEVARRKAAGELTEDEARAAIELLGDKPAADDDDAPVDDEPTAAAELDDVEAMLDDAFESIGRSRPH